MSWRQRDTVLSLCLSLTLGCAGPRGAVVGPRDGASGAQPVAAGAPTPVQDVADAESDARSLTSKVTRVTVYSDRARVTRQATADATAEPTVFAFRSLPGWVDDGSVQVSANGGRIEDVRVDRTFLARATDASWRKVETAHKVLVEQMAALRDELAVLDAQKAQIDAIKAFSTVKLDRDTVIGDVKMATYADVLAFIGESLRKTAAARRAAQHKLDELTPELEASQRRLDDARNLMKLEETTVLVTLKAAGPTPVTVDLTYMLPGVTWEPMHELRASTTDDKTVEVISFAAISQTSGEDWGGAELSFSTQSTTQSVRIPELEALTLGDTHTATRILTEQTSSFMRAKSAFEGQSQLWNKVRGGSSAERARTSFEQVYQSNLEYLNVVQGRTVSLFESLEKRGTTAHFKAQPVQSVRGDGHPVRLLIGRNVLGSVQEIVAAPEQSLNAARTLAMTNSTGQALLPGKVARYQDGTFLGMTDIDFIAKGEKFALFLGVADQIKLSRQLDKKQSTLVRKTRTQMAVVFVTTVENLSSEPTTFTLTDRVPVSENKDIRVDKISTPGARPDAQGLVRWDLTLKPGERREVKVGYQVEYPEELVIETKRRRMMAPVEAPSPASPTVAPPRRTRIEDQILDLETNF